MAKAWTRAHELERERIVEMLARERAPFDDQSKEGCRGRRRQPFLDWCQTYLPHYFDRPFARVHRLMAEAAGEPAMPTFIGAFRGAGKSVLLSLARPLRRLLDRQAPYLIYGAQVQLLAAEIADYVRIEIEHNQRIACDYGALRVDGSENEWVVDLGRGERDDRGRWPLRRAKVECFGIGQSPRGRRYRQYRPIEFVGDDLETAELARNPRREQQLWDWLFDEVLPALEPERYAFTVVGTMFGPGCMLERARAMSQKTDPQGRPLARYREFPATDPAGHSVWPERFSDAALARVRAQVGLRNWLRNYALVAEDPDKPFQAAWFGEYDPAEIDVGTLDVVAFLDPALSESSSGCPRALITVGMDRRSGLRYVLDAWITRGTPQQMVDQVLAVHARWDPRLIGIESNGGYALIKPLLEDRARGRWLPVTYVTHKLAKEVRIERLAPQFDAGRWLFPRNPSEGVRTLQQQLLSYPQGFVDGPDALAGCDELLPDTWQPRSTGAEYESLSRRRSLAGVL